MKKNIISSKNETAAIRTNRWKSAVRCKFQSLSWASKRKRNQRRRRGIKKRTEACGNTYASNIPRMPSSEKEIERGSFVGSLSGFVKMIYARWSSPTAPPLPSSALRPIDYYCAAGDLDIFGERVIPLSSFFSSSRTSAYYCSFDANGTR